MFVDKDLNSGLLVSGDESSQSKLTRHVSQRNKEKSDEKMSFPDKGIGFLTESVMDSDGFKSTPMRIGNSTSSQELTLSYLCDNSKLLFSEKDFSNKILLNSSEKASSKGKEVLVFDNSNQDEKWVERDFLSLNETRVNSLKREMEDEVDRESREKRQKLETLNLSLALPDVSLSLTASNALQNGDPPPARSNPARSIQSLASSANTKTTYSNDFTTASLSYSYSHPFSHNPSCSLTRNSTENYDDQIWNCGEGTNGSVHSRFRPVGDGVSLSNHGGGLYSLMQNSRKESCNNSLYRTTSSDNHSFFPSELPARPRFDTQSGDSRGRASESLKVLEGLDSARARNLSRPERILREIVTESIPEMAQVVQELTEQTLASTKEYLKSLISLPEKKEELVVLQKWLEKRSDLSKETLSKCQKDQLEILVAVKMGIESFLSSKNHLPMIELVEIFSFMRCRNVSCKSVLPIDDCECKICSNNKGFCSSCMCPVCLNFDCANNTCSWVGCDVCSHWCHASCGIEGNLIRPGPSLKGPSGTTEMQFHCLGCDHASEMFGFVKDVFLCCAKDWNVETLIKELDCVRKIFKGSDDDKGKELHMKAELLISKLESKYMSITDACNFIIQFFNYGVSELPASGITAKELLQTTQAGLRKDALSLSQPTSQPANHAVYSKNSSLQRDLLSSDLHRNDLRTSLLRTEQDSRYVSLSKADVYDNLESIVRIKDAEARMFQSKADDAQRDAEEFLRIIQAKTEKLEEEYTGKFAKLCVQETEERRRKKLEELKVLENSHSDYYAMKIRMQSEIAGYLERMEATRQKWV